MRFQGANAGRQGQTWDSLQTGSLLPLDALVDAVEATISVGVRDLCCRLNGNARNFEKAAENLKRAGQVGLSGETLRQVVEEEGKRALALAQAGELQPTWTVADCHTTTPEGRDVTRIYLGSDGFTMPLVTEAEKQMRRKKVQEKRQKRGKRAARCRGPRRGPTSVGRKPRW